MLTKLTPCRYLEAKLPLRSTSPPYLCALPLRPLADLINSLCGLTFTWTTFRLNKYHHYLIHVYRDSLIVLQSYPLGIEKISNTLTYLSFLFIYYVLSHL